MAFKELTSLDTDNTTSLGGKNKEGKTNPTSIEGYYVGSKDVESKLSKSGLCKLHVFQTKTGSVGVWGKTDMDRKMETAVIGMLTQVKFTGFSEPKPGKRPMYKYTVAQDSDHTIEVAPASETPTDAYTNDYAAEPEDETSLDEEETPMDEVKATSAPKRAVTSTPSQKRVEDLLAARRKTT